MAIGVSVALDDFGIGYSSLGYLHRFPIGKIKVDRSFMMDILTSKHSIAVLRSIGALADGQKIRTIAEGIETPERAAMLRLSGCDDGQGYLFARPIAGDAVIAMMAAPRVAAPPMIEATG